MHWSKWITVVLGIWLILSPYILGFTSDIATWNSIIVGFLVLAFNFASKRYSKGADLGI